MLTIAWYMQPVAVKAPKHAKPALATAQPNARLTLAYEPMAPDVTRLTTFSLRKRGQFFSSSNTAAKFGLGTGPLTEVGVI